MMRRRFPRRRTFRTRPFRRRFSGRKPVARSSFDKITLFNNLDGLINRECGPVVFPMCSVHNTPAECDPAAEEPVRCCVTLFNLNLVHNATLESFYQDRITLMRLYGDLWFRAELAYPTANECDNNVSRIYQQLYTSSYAEQWNASIRKRLLTQIGEEADPPGSDPDADDSSPIFGYDWTESSPPWNWQRSGMWMPRRTLNYEVLNQASIIGVCSDTSGGLALNPLSAGTGNIDTAISTNCNTVQAPLEGCPQIYNGASTAAPPWHHLRVRVNRHIVMARDQALNLTVAFRTVATVPGTPGWSCIDLTGTGLPAALVDTVGRGQISVYARIGATIKYN